MIEYQFIQVMKQKIHRRVFSYIKHICCIDGISLKSSKLIDIMKKERMIINMI